MRSIELIELLEDDESPIKIMKDDSPSRTKVPYIYTKQYAFCLQFPATRMLVANLLIERRLGILPMKEVGPIEL
jgi:hypothetical protein